MDSQIFEAAGKYAGLGGIAVIVLLYVFRQVLKLGIFKNVGGRGTVLLINNIINKLFWVTILALLAWLVVSIYGKPASPAASEASAASKTSSEPVRFAGTITDSVTAKPLEGVEVRMKPGGPVIATTDSEGIYGFVLQTPPPDSVTLIYAANGHKTRTETVYPSSNLNYPLQPIH